MLRLFFPESHRTDLPLLVGKRVPILVNLNFILIAYFTAASYLRFRADPEAIRVFMIAVSLTSGVFLVSLALIRLRKYLLASTISTVGIMLNVVWIAVLIPMQDERDLYRLSSYLLASCVVNSMLAIRKRQITVYGILGYVVFASIVLIFYVPMAGGFIGELRTIFMTMTLLYVPTNIVLIITSKLSGELIDMAEKELGLNRRKAAALDGLVNSAKGSMEVGRTLLGVTDESKRSGDAIRTALDKLKAASRGMTSDSRDARDANLEIVEFTRGMSRSISSQNAFLEETGTAIAEIMATISTMASLAERKKGTMDTVLRRIELQGNEIKHVVDSLEKIRGSSRDVLVVAGGILDVSEKTNLLAMNASIEAAHAGSAGKGFAVISGEIRKLSQETQQSTKSIGDALARNEDIVSGAASTVTGYIEHIESVIKDVRDTFHAMDEIIDGLGEISRGAEGLTSATGKMAEIARLSGETMRNVTEKIELGSRSVEHISEFSRSLDGMIETLGDDFQSIESSLRTVAEVGGKNIANIAVLESEMDRIGRAEKA